MVYVCALLQDYPVLYKQTRPWSCQLRFKQAWPSRHAWPCLEKTRKGRWSGELPSLPLANCDHAKVSLGF